MSLGNGKTAGYQKYFGKIEFSGSNTCDFNGETSDWDPPSTEENFVFEC